MDEFEDKTEEIGMKELELKYGCNPNQKPSRIYMDDDRDLPIEVLSGRPGYINFLDAFNGWQLVSELKEATGIEATIINPYYITGLDEAMLEDLKANHEVVITLEDGISDGGFGEKIARFYGASDMKVLNFGIKKEFLDRYDVNDVLKDNHLTVEQIVDDVKKCL